MWNPTFCNRVLFGCGVVLGSLLGPAGRGVASPPPDGTVVYCRHNPNNDLTTVWFVSLSGGTDTLITTGWMAHISLDRRHLVFLRNGPNGSAYGSRGDLWVRDLVTGAETNLYHDSDFIVSGDFTRDATQIVFDFECADYSIPSNGSANGSSTFLSGGNCYDDSPVVNPVDGRIAYHNNASGGGIGIASTNFQNKALVPNTALGTYASWSHDGQWLAYTLTSAYYTYAGYNLYKIHPDGSGQTQLTFLSGATNSFPIGAAWAGDDTALIGVGTINGTNGLYRVAADGSGAISLLTITQPGDPVAYVGAVLGNPSPPFNALLTATNTVLIYWPSPSTGFNLQQNTNLAAATWLDPAEPVNDNGAIRYVVVANPTGSRLFRLAKP
jgi:hypothetical protein